MVFMFGRGILRFSSFVSIGLILSGCTTTQTPLSQDTVTRINRVAVISQTAKTFTRQYTGLTVFGNEREEIEIDDWNIDSQYQSVLGEQIEKTLNLSVVRVPYAVDEFSHVNDLNGPWDAPAFSGPNWDAIEGASKKHCSTNKLDAIFVLAKAKTGDFLGGTNQFFGGAGIYVRGPRNRVSVLHLISKIALIDCKTGKPIAVRTLASVQIGTPGAILRSSPIRPLPATISGKSISQLTDEQRQQIQAGLVALPNNAWIPTLTSMFSTNP